MSKAESVTEETSMHPSRSESDDWDLIPIQPGSAELSVESALLWCLNPAIHGIKSIGVPAASEKARKLIEVCNGDTTAAIVMASGGEGGSLKRSKIIFDFLLRQVPFVGCPAYILTSTWTHVRSVAVIAAIYGHDLEQPRTQHEILWCLIPHQPEGMPASDTGPIGTTARTVANILVSSALKKAMGVSMVGELFQLGTDLWAVSSTTPGDGGEEEYEHLSLGPSATARHYFCPETQWNGTNFMITLAGVVIPWLFRVPRQLLFVIALCIAFLYMNKRRLCGISAVRSIDLKWIAPRAVAYSVFLLHAALPVFGIANGLNSFVTVFSGRGGVASTADRVSQAVLGTMALSSGLRGTNLYHPELMHTVYIESRKIALVIGLVIHVLPLLDRNNTYTDRIAWLLSDTQLCSLERSLHFVSVVVSSSMQQMLFQQLRNRDVILRLLGAERVMILSLTLFFRGISAAVTTESLFPFFKSISPHPIFCCFVMTLRKFTVQAALLCALVPLIPEYVSVPMVSLIAGLAVGILVVVTTWKDWKLNQDVYMSNMRLLFILPGAVTGKTKQVVDSMLKAGGRTAVKSVFVRIVKKLYHTLLKQQP